MDASANVNSVDVIKDFRTSWVRFSEDARNALTDVDFDLSRTMEWLTNEQRLYWQTEIKRANEMLSRARTELHRKKLGGFGEHKPDTTVEEKRLRTAKERLELCEEKLETVKRWIPELQHAAQEYRTQSQPLADMLEGDFRRALGKLDRMLDAIEAYLSLQAPSTPAVSPLSGLDGGAPAPATAPSPISRGEPEPTTAANETQAEAAAEAPPASPLEVEHG
jgi:hypothetical protein